MYTAPRLHSVETLQPGKIFLGTAYNPIQVRANDLNYYVTKVQATPSDETVIREYLGAHFLKLWNLPVPDFAIIDVNPAHIPDGLHRRLTAYEFSRPAFGSRFIPDAIYVMDADAMAGAYQVRQTEADTELIHLSLFDLWLANNDRNWNNYNLLYRFPPNTGFIPIDHERLFDHGSPGDSLPLQTDNENLSATPVFTSFVGQQRIRAYCRDQASKQTFAENVASCQLELPRIKAEMPLEWSRLCPDLIDRCAQTIFDQAWLDKVWRQHLVQLAASASPS